MTVTDTTLYRRRPLFVYATRITSEGNLPNAGLAWIERLIAERRLVRGEMQWVVNPGKLHIAAAYPGQWVVLIVDLDHLFVMDDEQFQATYERVETEEHA